MEPWNKGIKSLGFQKSKVLVAEEHMIRSNQDFLLLLETEMGAQIRMWNKNYNGWRKAQTQSYGHPCGRHRTPAHLPWLNPREGNRPQSVVIPGEWAVN